MAEKEEIRGRHHLSPNSLPQLPLAEREMMIFDQVHFVSCVCYKSPAKQYQPLPDIFPVPLGTKDS